MMGLGKGGSGFKYGHFWYAKFLGGNTWIPLLNGGTECRKQKPGSNVNTTKEHMKQLVGKKGASSVKPTSCSSMLII